MASSEIPSAFPFTKKYASVLGSRMAYVDIGPPTGQTVLFLHGNPTSSYLWRNILPHVSPHARCIAVDLIGMGSSDKVPSLAYRFTDHFRYLSAFLDTILPASTAPKLILAIHDWGSALGLHWAHNHPSRVAGIALMEFAGPLPSWDLFPPEARAFIQAFQDPERGREMLIEENMFIEKFLPSFVKRGLSPAAMDAYRAPFLRPEDREPLYRWPNEIAVANHPPDVVAVVDGYHAWLMESELPKLFFWADPGMVIDVEKARWYEAHLKNTRSVGIGEGLHYLQEDNPELIGEELARWVVELGEAEGKGEEDKGKSEVPPELVDEKNQQQEEGIPPLAS